MMNFIKNIGPTELAIIALILVIFFGGKAISRLATVVNAEGKFSPRLTRQM
jgi:Sec-independent protein translocase protein TatA